MTNPLNKDITFISNLFEGRIPRKQYWISSLATIAAINGLVFANIMFSMATGTNSVAQVIVYFVISAAIIFYGFVSSVKRCHDRNKSGWFMLLAPFPPLSFWLIFELGFLSGTVGNNKYGPDPLMEESSEENAYLKYRREQSSDMD